MNFRNFTPSSINCPRGPLSRCCAPAALALAAAAAFLLGFPASTARADEQYFGYTYPAEGLPKGAWEIYQWVTMREGRVGKPDTAINLSNEIEYGFTDRLTGSFYVDWGYFSGEEFVFQGLKTAWKYFVTTPVDDGFGLGFYLEPIWARTSSTSGAREDKWAIEAKVLLQKNFFENQLVWATNFTSEFEWERHPGDAWERVLELAVSSGLSWRLGGGWYLGVEGLYETEFEGFGLDQQEQWQIAAGPTLHWMREGWWATLTFLPQVIGSPETDGSRNLGGYDEYQIRLKFGRNF